MRLIVEKTKKVDVPNDPDMGYINIRALSMEELAEIESKASDMVVGEKGVNISLNNYEKANRIAGKCLKGWGNMFDSKGEELKYNSSSLEMMSHLELMVEGKKVRFLEWVCDCHTKFREEIKEEEGVAQGN